MRKLTFVFLTCFWCLTAVSITAQDSLKAKLSDSLKTLLEEYRAAVKDAMTADTSEISSSLLAIKPDNTYLAWAGGRTLVVTWSGGGSAFSPGDTISAAYDIWVTAVPELRDWYKRHCDVSEKVDIRTKQLLGLPPGSMKKCFMEMWVLPGDLFRPAYDNEIDDSICGVSFPKDTKEDYRTWFTNTMNSSYPSVNPEAGYPWTRLGYTYDWGNPKCKIGLSEFVIRKNSRVIINSVIGTRDYFEQCCGKK